MEVADRGGVGAGVVSQAEFPVRVDLLADGIDGKFQPLRVDVMNGNQNANGWPVGEMFDVVRHRGSKPGRDSRVLDVGLMGRTNRKPPR